MSFQITFQIYHATFRFGTKARFPAKASECREAKLAVRQVLPLNCHAITLTLGAILKEWKRALSCGGEAAWEASEERIWVRLSASQQLRRVNIFTARHSDVSHVPLGAFSGQCRSAEVPP